MDACDPQLISGGPGEALRVVTLCGSVKPSFSGTEDFHDTLVDMLRQRGAGVSPVDPGGWGLGHVPKLLRSVAAARPDVILLQYPTDAFGTRLGPHAFCALHRGAPLVVTLHEFTAAHPLRRASLAILLARADAVIATAETERRGLLSWYPWLRRRICVIPIGPNTQGRPWRPAGRPRVVYFGQIRPEKGLEEFFACRDALAADFPQAEFVIAGSFLPRFAQYQQTIESAARQRDIRLVKEMPPEQVSDFLSSATVALLPFPSGASFRRGTLLAAAACGVPIVTLAGPDTPPEMHRLLEPATCHDGLVAQLAAFLSRKAARETGHHRSRALAAMVSWHSIADRYLDTLNRVRSGAALPADAAAPTPVQAPAS